MFNSELEIIISVAFFLHQSLFVAFPSLFLFCQPEHPLDTVTSDLPSSQIGL